MRSKFNIREFNPILAFLMCFKTLSKLFQKGLPTSSGVDFMESWPSFKKGTDFHFDLINKVFAKKKESNNYGVWNEKKKLNLC